MRLLFSLCALAAFTANATEYWVQGVSPTGGWQDANKTLENDRSLCWAATAANMLAWWQAQQMPFHPQEAEPRGISSIWQTLRDSFQDGGGETYNTLVWWFNGSKLPAAMKRTDYGMGIGGYYRQHASVCGADFPAPFILQETPRQGMSERIKELLCNGYAIGIGIRRIDREKKILPYWHMLSLWGIEYDEETRCITRVYLTDSDDIAGEWPHYQHGLFAADVTEQPVVDEKGDTFTGLTLRNKIGWFKNNAVITTLIALNAQTARP